MKLLKRLEKKLKSNDQKDLLIEEYESHFSYQEKTSNLNISFNRVAFIFFIFLIISIIFSTKAVYLGSLKKKITQNKLIKSEFRSGIVDNNGNIIAKTVITNNVGINPNLVIDKKKLLLNLQLIFPKKSKTEFIKIKRKLNENKFFYIAKKIDQDQLDELILLGDKSIITEQKISRIYPHENLFSHIIGQIDDNNNGISGIEKSFNNELKKNYLPLKLTLDTDIQYLIREELKKYEEIFQSLGSAAILMDINSGDIISLVSLPDFNLNKREEISDINFINRATKGVYEFGSVFKTFTLAAAFDEKIIEPLTEFNDSEDILDSNQNISPPLPSQEIWDEPELDEEDRIRQMDEFPERATGAMSATSIEEVSPIGNLSDMKRIRILQDLVDPIIDEDGTPIQLTAGEVANFSSLMADTLIAAGFAESAEI